MKTVLKVWTWAIGFPFIIIGAMATAVVIPIAGGLTTGAHVVGKMFGDAFPKAQKENQ